MQWSHRAQADRRLKVVLATCPATGDSPMPDPSRSTRRRPARPGAREAQPRQTVVVRARSGRTDRRARSARHPERCGLVAIDAGLKSPIRIPDQQEAGFLEFINENYDPS